MSVLVVTSLGDIVIDLYADRCPLTCKNFLKLCKIKYYNGCLFHNIQKDFTAQTGDPTGTGTAGDSVYKFLHGDQARFFTDEIHLDLKHTKTGTVAMASAGENLNASQFYFTLRDDLDYLDGKHTVFGEVAEGLETLERINEAYVDEKGRPYKNIRIKHTYILDDPFDDPTELAELIPDASPDGKPKDEVDDDVRLEDDWVPMDEQLDPAEFEEVIREKQAHSSAVVLESIGDIPEAEVKPPENVLFVCKLNPVTEDEDLHTIFSRFGAVVSADIIRDYKTGDSLCYAFIEFEDKDACEQAYFKMDNALIDDRRIHVDFSQSVAKLWSQFRRRENQPGKGKGCFKCGAPDHIAKDCPGEEEQLPPKYVLKDNNRQRGEVNNSKYDMVFDDDDPGSLPHGKRESDHRSEDRADKRRAYRYSSEDVKSRDDMRKRLAVPQKHTDRARESSGDKSQNKRSHRNSDGRDVEDKEKYYEKSGRHRGRVEEHIARDARSDKVRDRDVDVDVRNKSESHQSHRRDNRDDRNNYKSYRKNDTDGGRKRSRDDDHVRKGRDEKTRNIEQESRGHSHRSSDHDSGRDKYQKSKGESTR
uniref:Peptidyl-prolyl cis-trans isomerase n=1 Tax=Kalanchoe fedtschenkoi TaxID=63787 RepID=A0A7N0V7B5_KALFE